MDIIQWITVIINIILTLITTLTYFHNRKSNRKNQFISTVNSNQAELRRCLADKSISETALNNSKMEIPLYVDSSRKFVVDSAYSVFKSAYRYVCDNLNRSTIIISGSCAMHIWQRYVSELNNRSELEQVFKCLYRCLKYIEDSKIDESAKREHINNLSCMLTSEQLLCYLLNLNHYCKGDCTTDPTVKILQKYDFFKDLWNSHEYRDIEDRLSIELKKPFSQFVK